MRGCYPPGVLDTWAIFTHLNLKSFERGTRRVPKVPGGSVAARVVYVFRSSRAGRPL